LSVTRRVSARIWCGLLCAAVHGIAGYL